MFWLRKKSNFQIELCKLLELLTKNVVFRYDLNVYQEELISQPARKKTTSEDILKSDRLKKIQKKIHDC